MRRYVVRNHRSGTTERHCATLGEALAAAIKLIEEGPDGDVVDTQGSGEILVNNFDLREAEAYLRRSLGSDEFDKPQTLKTLLDGIRKKHKKEKKSYHWDFSNSDIR
jgi:hypothetical protein